MQKQWIYSLTIGVLLLILMSACSRSQSQTVKQEEATNEIVKPITKEVEKASAARNKTIRKKKEELAGKEEPKKAKSLENKTVVTKSGTRIKMGNVKKKENAGGN